MTRCSCVGGLAVLVMTAAGCSPMSAVHWGVKLVGDAVNHVDVQEREQQLLGRQPAAADEMFGERLDVLCDTRGNRVWIIYPVKLDVLDQYRYVVEVAGSRIVALSKTQKNAKPELDIPKKLIFEQKVKGEAPAECEASLGLGPPLLTVKSETTGHLIQLYREQMIEIQGITKPHYCVLRFDGRNRCAEVDLVSVVAESGEAGLGP